jgi:iron complex transport system substrate-binding protein
MERVVSLLPSATEIVCRLGLEETLVGRSHECDFPSRITDRPILTAPKLDADRPSAEINDRVLELVREGLSVYRIDATLLREIKPTLILTQDQCEVCAASLRDLEDALEAWIGIRPQVLSVNPMTLADVWRDIERVATAIGAGNLGREVSTELRNRVDSIAAKTTREADTESRPSVACIEWIDPLMAAGNWVPELVELAGGRNLFGRNGEHSPWLDWSVLRDADPDIIVVMPCGFDIRRIRAELEPLLVQPGWSELRAVRDQRVYLTDGNQYFNRPGPRLVDSLEILAEIIQPNLFDGRHQGSGWQQLGEVDLAMLSIRDKPNSTSA